MNDNRTHIYRIRRKEDGLFLVSAPCRKDPFVWDQLSTMWGPVGVFWRKPETVRSHLLGLCQRRFYICEKQESIYDLRRSRKGPRQRAAKENNPFWLIVPHGTPVYKAEPRYEWLDKYEIIATEITVHGENKMEATDFVNLIDNENNEKDIECLQ